MRIFGLIILEDGNFITRIPAKVYNFNNDNVTLNCMIDTDKKTIVQKTFPKKALEKFVNLDIDTSVEIEIKVEPGKITTFFHNNDIEATDKVFADKQQFQLKDLDIFNKE